jgi:hypothetical protein
MVMTYGAGNFRVWYEVDMPSTGVCPNGTYPYTAGVLSITPTPFDATFAASAFAFFFSAVIVLWATGKACGSILRVLRRS